MAVQTFVSHFVKPTGKTNGSTQSVVANIPFEPNAIEMWTAANTNFETFDNSTPANYGVRYSKGFTGEVGNAYSTAWMASAGDLFGLTNDGGWFWSRSLGILQYNIFGIGLECNMDITSYDNLGGGLWGFSLVYPTSNSGAPDRIICYRAYGGISNANVVRSDASGGTITGAGFCADLVKVLGALTSPDEGTGLGMRGHVGCFNHELEQWSACLTTPAAFSGTTAAERGFCDDGYALWVSNSGTKWTKRSVTALTTDGFTFSTTTSGGGASGAIGGQAFLFLKGVSSKIISVAKRSSGTGTQNVSIPFTPIDVEIAGTSLPSGTTAADNGRICIGGSDGTRSRAALTEYESGLSASTIHAYPYTTDDAVFVKVDNNTPAVDAVATVSFSSNSVDLNWTTNDGDADLIGICAVAASGTYAVCDAGGGGGGGGGGARQFQAQVV